MSMEVKASKASQRANAGRVSKTASKASVTPSQMSERTRLNRANQNRDPLDSLSRWPYNQMAERRSGLQDVDDEYLKNVVYGYAGRTRLAAEQRNTVRADMMPAGVPTMRGKSQQQAAGQQRMAAGGNNGGGSVAEQLNMDALPPNQQKAAETAPATQAQHVAQENVMANQPSNVVPIQQNPAAGVHQQQQLQTHQPVATPAMPQQPVAPRSPADPEMYTTCPNCRATLYLVRNPGDPSPYASPPAQQQEQQGQQQTNQQQGGASVPVNQ